MRWLSELWSSSSDLVRVALVVGVCLLVGFLVWMGFGGAVQEWLGGN